MFFIFMQFLEKIGKNNRLAPPRPLGNPGSSTVIVSPSFIKAVPTMSKFRS